MATAQLDAAQGLSGAGTKMTQRPTPNDDDGVLAAEYVVGLLSGPERAAVKDRLRTDQGFTAQVDTWENYFAGLNEDYGSMQPSPQVKAVIDQRLFATAKTQSRWWIWSGLVAAVLMVAIVIGSLSLGVGNAPSLVAQLESTESPYRFVVSMDDADAEVEIALTAGERVAERTFELWLIPDGGTPRSLGTFMQAGQLSPLENAQLRAGAVLAVSLEPLGGSPTGAPTGPVLAVGTLNDA